VSYSQASGTAFALGATTVTATATDTASNSSLCSFTVTVRDTTAPSLTCPANVTVETLDPTGADVSYGLASATDTSSSVTVSYSYPSGSRFVSGVTPVSVTATDAAGNVTRCDFQVSVQPRSVSTPAPTADAGGCGCASDTSGSTFLAWGALLLLACRATARRSRLER
jgi:hypothetical protein